jgi:hypothetical protein
MQRRAAFFRRLGAILCTVLMMHTSWMAATASCEQPTYGVGGSAHVLPNAEVSAPMSAHANGPAPAHHHHAPAAPSTPPTSHHDAPASCPMAMACTLSVMTAEVPTIEVHTVAQTSAMPTSVADAPHWALVAPEPPPPRG